MMSQRDRLIFSFLAELTNAVGDGEVSADDVWQVMTEPRPTGLTIVDPLEAVDQAGRASTLLHMHRCIQETPVDLNGPKRDTTGK